MRLIPRFSQDTSVVFVLACVLAHATGQAQGTRAAATELASARKPLVHLRSPQTVQIEYEGSADAVAALKSGSAKPTAMASADFNADGAMDVVAGYSTPRGGVVTLILANVDAFAPKDTSLYAKAMRGEVPATFMPAASAYEIPESPDLIVTGDFNRDGHQDVLVAARGGHLYLLTGDGHGTLLKARRVPLDGAVRSMAATPDGHVAVSMLGEHGPEVQILAAGKTGLTEGDSYPLPAAGDSLVWGTLGGSSADLAVGAGSNIVFIYGALEGDSRSEIAILPFSVRALAEGDFTWDRDGRTEIAALGDDGKIHILHHGTLNTAPMTAADRTTRSRSRKMKQSELTKPNPTALGPWTVARELPYKESAPAGPLSASAFNSPRLAASSTQDLMVLEGGRSQLHILDTSRKTESPSADVSFTGAPVAALALPQKIDAGRDTVVLVEGQTEPLVMNSSPDPTFNVTWVDDEDDAGACSQSSSVKSGAGADGNLSLREAVCEANNNGAATSVINVPAGTYDLAIKTYGGNGSGSSSGELQVGINSGNNISIVGSGAGTTIIQQTDGVDRIIEADEELEGNMPLAISNLTLQNGACTDSGLDCLDNGGGAILAGGASGDTLALTNVTFRQNKATSASGTLGGAVAYTGPSLTITGSIFSNNTASGTGGAEGGGLQVADIVNGSSVAGTATITDSIFSGNSATSGNDGNADGGGLYFEGAAGFSGSVTGSAFTGNTASSTATTGAASGGGIIALGGTFSLSNSRIVGNRLTSSSDTGSGYYGIELTSTITDNWWGCNAGPGASGCDAVVFDNSGGGSGTFNPWLVLSIGANPTSVLIDGTSTLTAAITTDSNGGTGFSVPDGTGITFGATLGTDNPTSTALSGGSATSTFTAGDTAGSGSGTATVDNQIVSVGIDVTGTPPSITSASSTTGEQNIALNFSVTTTGNPSPTLSVSNIQNAIPGINIPSTGAGSIALTGTPTAAGTSTFKITASNNVSPNATQNFTLTVNPHPSFSSASSTTGTVNSALNFSVTTTGGVGTISLSVSNIQNAIPGINIPSTGTGSITLSGTPTATGTCTFTITATDSLGGGAVQNFSLTVNSPQETLTISANPAAGGTVTPTSGSTYSQGTSVPITATANAGYTFQSWSSSPDAVANPVSANTTIPMNSNETVTAQFSANLVVYTPNDDSGTASNCVMQTTPGVTNNPDSSCSLRDALLEAAALGAANISFDSTQFATAQTITLGSAGTLTIPPNTTITGPTSGSGYTLTNLVTVAGGGSSSNFSVFTVNSGVTAASISGLTITNGKSQNSGGGIDNSGALTVSNSTISGNSATSGGGIFNQGGTLTVLNSTFSTNSTSSAEGAGIASSGGTLTVNSCTFWGNTSGTSGGGIASEGTAIVSDSTFSGNSASSFGGGIYVLSGSLTLANNIVSGNSVHSGPDDVDGSYTDKGGNILGYVNGTAINSAALDLAPLANYGGPTLTMLPLPGSSAICAGTLANWNAASLTTDQREFSLTDPNCPSGSNLVDAGSVQTNYVMDFSSQPPTSAAVGQPIFPGPVVSLSESNTAATAASGTVTMTDSQSLLSASGSTASLANGTVAFTNLVVNTATTGDQLTASLSLNPGLSTPLSLVVPASTTLNVYAPATMTSPGGGSTFTGNSVTFSWTTASGATGYLLHLGSTGVGSGDLDSSGEIAGTSVTFNSLPANGGTIYARLFTYFGSFLAYEDYVYTAVTPAAATLSSPVPSSTLASTSITFGWSATTGATKYLLELGSTGAGSSNLYNSGGVTGTSVTANNLPGNGETIYARLYTYVGTTSTYTDTTYTDVMQSTLTTPTPGNTLTGSTVTFDWTAATGATGYLLHLGNTGVGSSNLDSSGQIAGTTVTFSGLPANGGTINARLYTYFGAASAHTDYTYTAVTPTAATLSSPAPSSTLTSPSTAFGWAAVTGATKYLLELGSTGVGSSNLYSSGGVTGTSVTANNLPGNGETVYARLYTYFGTTAVSADFTYTDVTQSSLTTPTPGSAFTGASVTFDWTAASGATGYLLHLGNTGVGSSNLGSTGKITGTTATLTGLPANAGTINARLYTYFGTASAYTDYTYTAASQSALTSPAPSSTLTGTSVTFNWTAVTGATGYLLHLGSTGAGSSNLDSSGQMTGTSVTFSGLPANGETINARLYTYYGTASAYTDYTYTALTATAATLSSPTPASTLTSPSTTFGWTAITGATKYLLELGTTGVGSSNLYTSGGVTGTTATANNLPANGETIYARLFTYFGTTSVSADFTYTDVAQSILTTPTPGSAFTSTSVTFDWTAATGATKYLLHLGSTGVGSSNLDSSGQITGTTVTFTGLPTNGETIYARLYTYFGTASAYTDYTYTAQ